MGDGLVEAALQQQRSGEVRSGLAGVGADAQLPEPAVGAAEVRLGGDRVPGQQLDDPGEVAGLQQALAEADLLGRRPGGRQQGAGGVEPSPERFEHGLAADRGGLDLG